MKIFLWIVAFVLAPFSAKTQFRNEVQLVFDQVDPIQYTLPDSALVLLNELEHKFGEDLNDQEYIQLSYYRGNIYWHLAQMNSSLIYYDKSYQRAKAINDTSKMVRAQADLGYVFTDIEKYDSAIVYLLRASEISEEANLLSDRYRSQIYLAHCYELTGKLRPALDIYKSSIDFFRENGTEENVRVLYINVGNTYLAMGELDTAQFYYEKVLKEAGSNIETNSIAELKLNLAKVYEERGKYEKSIALIEEAQAIFQRNESLSYVYLVMKAKGLVYTKMGNNSKAIELFKSALVGANKINDLSLQIEVLTEMSQTYKEIRDFESAFNAQVDLKRLEDSLIQIQNKNFAEDMQAQYQNAKNEKEIALLHKEKELKEVELDSKNAEVDRANFLKIVFGLGLGVFAILTIFIIRGLRQKQRANKLLTEQKEQIEEKNKEIVDSINYAKRIQKAILPPQKMFKELFKDSFVIYKPKDVVAGDFYWMEVKASKVMFAAADCTGHGVPGAMVSVICNNALNRSVREYGLEDPAKILDQSREIVIQEFEKSDEDVKDGMDIALCIIEGNNLTFAGAHNPLWIYRNGEFIEIKGDKQPVGKFYASKPFISQHVELQKGDNIYIFSDGLVDQFGGEKGKKFKAKAFRELLVGIQNLSMTEQKLKIESTFENWKRDFEQIDDVCVIGVRV